MFPTLEEMKEITETTDCRRIPVCREIYSDAFTPIEVMRTLKAASRHCYLLESAENDQKWGRYSFLGLCIHDGADLHGRTDDDPKRH